jgi:leader peptidase (prepilin peptidase) / N-methyltransferase
MIIFFYLLLFILGLVLGSFLSVLIHRIHNDEKGIFFGSSMCPQCNKKLGPLELIPLISYIGLRGKCKKCKKHIPWHYPVLELSTGSLFVAMALLGVAPLPLYAAYAMIFVFIFFYDLLYQEIPDVIMIPSIILALVGTFFTGTPSFLSGLYGALILVLFFLAQILVSKGKWIGGGDLRIGAFMGFVLGLKLTILATFFGYLAGAIISIFLLATGFASRKTMIAFGPFLIIGTLIALFYGQQIADWYLNLILL